MKRRHLLTGVGSLAAGGAALLGTNAFTTIRSDRAAVVDVAGDAAGWLRLQPADGPNGDYAFVRNEQLELDVSADNPAIPSEGVNADSAGRADRVFTIRNQGTQPVAVWITDESDRVTFTSTTDDHGIIEERANAKPVGVGETITVGFEVNTFGSEPGEQLLSSIVIHAVATDAEVPEDGDEGSEAPRCDPSAISEPHGTVPDDLAAVLSEMDGDGSESNPYLIEDDHNLQAMQADLTANYKLCGSIDASETGEWNGGDGFDPVGNRDNPFTGSLDGNGGEIIGLTTDRLPLTNVRDFIGLFGNVGDEGVVENITLLDVTMTGDRRVGGLIGRNNGEVRNADVSGSVDSSGTDVGGIVGQNRADGEILDSDSDVLISNGDESGGASNAGGVIGNNEGLVENCSAVGDVEGKSQFGGLIGLQSGSGEKTLRNCSAEGDVTSVSDTGGGNLGGLIGNINEGLFVELNLTIENCSATGDVTGDGSNLGGLVGQGGPDGLVIRDCSASGNVEGPSEGRFKNGYGGLVGSGSRTVEECFAEGKVEGLRSVGGLIGSHGGSGAKIKKSAAFGDVVATGSDNNSFGGLVGNTERGDVEDSYALGDVSVGENNRVGGLAGEFNTRSSITTSFSVGEPTGDLSVGGLAGSADLGLGDSPDDFVTDSYWDEEASGTTSSVGGTGLITSEMTGSDAPSNMSGFDFTDTWETVEGSDSDATGDGYPILQALDRERQLDAQGLTGN